MSDTPLLCRVCGIAFPAAPGTPANDWPTANCPTCGDTAVVCRGDVVCSACGIEYRCETAWLEAGVPVAKCPTCGSIAAIRHPEPPPPSPAPAPAEPTPTAPPPSHKDERAPIPSPPWTPAPWPPPAPSLPAVDVDKALRAAERVTGIVLLLFMVACVLPSFRVGSDNYQPGILGLLCGWITCIFWLPNPLMFFGCRRLLSGQFQHAFVLGVFACLCSLPIFALPDMLANLLWGYYVWQADIVLYTLASGALWRRYGARVAKPHR